MADLIYANNEFKYSNTSSVTTDFDVYPYNDDFDDDNNFYKILFKPSYPVQARELNQIQSILQDQIQKFGQHIFTEGSQVLGGKYTLDTRAHFVKINDKDLLGADVDIETFKDQIVTGQTTGIRAYVSLVLSGSEGTEKPKTLYVTYLSGNADTDEVAFTPGEPLVSNVGTIIVGSANTIPVGFGSVFTINEGVRFAKQHFIKHTKQSVVVDRYDINPTCKVGFFLNEDIIDASQDSSLLDPALEASKFAGPGADRFKITPVLTRLDIDDTAGYPDFVNLFSVIDGKVIELNERPTYNIIRDEIARRTMDESGDYYVRGFNTIVEEHLDSGNGGYLSYDRGGNPMLLSVQVEPGTAYVKGYEVNKLVTSFLDVPKATSYNNVNSQIISSKLGNYLVVSEAVGAWDVNSGQTIDLYDTAQRRITTGGGSTASQTGTKIGTARVKSISYDSGSLGTANGKLRVHIFDTKMLGTNSFSSVKSVYYNNTTTADIGADVVLNAQGKAPLQESYTPLLYFAGSNFVKTIRANDGSVDTTFSFKKTSDISISSGGTFTLTSPNANEIFPYGTTNLSTEDARDIFLTLNASANVTLPGTAGSGASSNTLTGVGTAFNALNAGDRIRVSGNTSLFTIQSITGDTEVIVSPNLPSVFSGNTFTKAYLAGDMIDMTSKGAGTGFARTIAATPTGITVNLNETLGSTVSGTVSYTMSRTNAREIKKNLRRNRYVVIDCSTAGTTGPFNLGFSDIYRINEIRTSNSAFTTSTQGTDVTPLFNVSNGQADDYYGHGSIIPLSGAGLTASDKLLVCLDYFEPDYTLGVGYFSIDSYPINDVNRGANEISTLDIPVYRSPVTGFVADLRNYFDFRPVFTNTAADSTTVGSATVNPAAASSIQYESTGLRLPAESEQIVYDYQYYIGRIDIVTLNKDGQFMVIHGVPSVNPITPVCPSHLMSCARIVIPPYPSLSPQFGRILGRNDQVCSSSRTSHIRFTMRDIGVLKQRVDNIENYVSLSLLEKSALDMKILDENGLDRFKNGIFVDSFTSFSLSDYANEDHHICYDPREGSIRPIFESQAIGYNYYSGTNIQVESNLAMLPYVEVMATQQPYATTFRNVETTVFRFVGKLYLDPDKDYWVNTDRLATQTYNFGTQDRDVNPYSIVYGSWQTTVTGITKTDPKLISSTMSSTSSTTGTAGTGKTTTQRYQVSDLPRQIDSLIAAYGGSTPVVVKGYLWAYAGEVDMNFDGSFQVTLNDLAEASRFMIPLGQSGAPIKVKNAIPLEASRATIEPDNPLTGAFAAAGVIWVNSADFIEVKVTDGGTVVTSTQTAITNTYQTTASTGSQATRTFTETFQSLQTEMQSIGDRVVTVAPIADIRPQIIAFEGRGLKANTKHFVFFDGQLMSSFVTPGTMENLPAKLYSNTSAALITTTGVEGDSLYTNENGIVYGFLRLPSTAEKTFRTGTKELFVTDSPTNEPDATSSARGYFYAQGINQTVQETILSTAHIVTETKSGVEKKPVVYSNTSNVYTTTTRANTSNVSTGPRATITYIDYFSCMGYSFKLNTPNGEEGTFLSSVDVFFADKDPNLGVWFEIRAMDNSGNITKTQVPGSEVWLESSEVNTSTDSSVATNIKFKAPVFLLNNVEYAFIIHTVGLNPNYYMFVSVLGQKDLLTQKYVNERPLTGTLFTTNNNTDWDIVPRVDLKITFNRAKFTASSGELVLGNQQREYVLLPLSNQTWANTSWFGERIVGNDVLTLSAPSGGTIAVGDLIVGNTSGTNAAISVIDGSTYTMNKSGYTTGESLAIRRSNGYLTAVTSSIVSKTAAGGNIYRSNPKNTTGDMQSNNIVLVVENTNGTFKANDTLYGGMSGAIIPMTSFTKSIYSTVQLEPSYLDFVKTDISFDMLTTSNTGAVGEYTSLPISTPVDFDDEKAIYSRTQEISLFSGAPSNRLRIGMSTQSDYLSPIVDIERTYSVYIHNLINSNTSGELSPAGGALKNKYISQVITLADGQDAEDLRIIITGYRPSSSNAEIKMYARISHSEDFESIYKRSWVAMEPFDATAYSSLSNRKDWREFHYKFPDTSMVAVNDQEQPIVGYTNGANTTFSGYKQYQIKIGLQSDNSAIFPRVADLRCIALQK
jgi:hypothetical protein